MIIDAHTHIAKYWGEGGNFERSFKALLKEMKANKVAKSFVIPFFEEKENESPRLETVLRLTENYKEISVIGTLDVLKYSAKDIEKLKSYLSAKKIIGIKLYPGYQHFYPSDKICAPIYELCVKFNVPVIFHSGDTVSYRTKAKVQYSHPLHIDSVATDFPDLKIVIAHLGNPWLIDCSEVLYKNKNVYADLSGLVEGGSLNSPYGALMKKRIQELIAYSFSSKPKLLYGTDWPLSPMKQYVKFIKSLGLSKQDSDYVFYKNAVNLFNL